MRRSLRVALLAASLVAAGIPAATAAPATASDKAAFVRQAIDTHFVPRIDAFARTTGPLLQSIDAMCNVPGRETLAAARRAFVTSLLAWENASASFVLHVIRYPFSFLICLPVVSLHSCHRGNRMIRL